jgi:hypothetical protein
VHVEDLLRRTLTSLDGREENRADERGRDRDNGDRDGTSRSALRLLVSMMESS